MKTKAAMWKQKYLMESTSATYLNTQEQCVTGIKCSGPVKAMSCPTISFKEWQHDTFKHAVIRCAPAPQGGSGKPFIFANTDWPFSLFRENYRAHCAHRSVYWLVPCTRLFTSKLGEHNVVHWGCASHSTHIFPTKSSKDVNHPHTLTCACWCRASSV